MADPSDTYPISGDLGNHSTSTSTLSYSSDSSDLKFLVPDVIRYYYPDGDIGTFVDMNNTLSGLSAGSFVYRATTDYAKAGYEMLHEEEPKAFLRRIGDGSTRA
jgi:hypothetical protein